MSKSFGTIVAALAGLIVLSSSQQANAQVCSNQSLKGSFGYTVTGTITKTTRPLIAGPFVAVGKLTFDGVGGVKTVRSFNDNGFALREDPGTGSYTMNKDCTGSFTITVGPSTNQVVLSLDIVLDDTNQLRGVVTTADVVLSLEGRKQLPIIYF
jgi:hypothetical protein